MSDYPASSGSAYLDLAQLLRVLKERKWIIIALALAALCMSLALSMTSTPLYRATSDVLLQNTTLDKALFGSQIFQVSDQQRALTTAANLVVLDRVAEMVKADLASSQSVQSLREMITVTTAPAADLIAISAVSSVPSKAADVANSFARQFINYRQESDRATLRKAQAQVQAQLDAMTTEERTSARGLTLSQYVEELAVLESMQTGGFELVEEATVPTSAFSPRTYRNAAIALVLGLLLGLVISFLLHVFDRRIKDEETVQREFGTPVIATIPLTRHRLASGMRRATFPVGFAESDSPMLEAFRTLRSNLAFFQIDRQLKTILVSSPLPREGKTTTAINLALTLAMSGSRVIIVDADLRRPMLREYLGLKETSGFSNMLSDTGDIARLVQAVDLDKFVSRDHISEGPRTTGGPISRKGLFCITSGPLPPNPAELMAMDKTTEVLHQLAGLCDYLIVDAPPRLLVSDALELAKKVDGVVLVARLMSTRIEEARRARESLRRIGVAPLGVVVSGEKGTKAYYRRYGGYYAES